MRTVLLAAASLVSCGGGDSPPTAAVVDAAIDETALVDAGHADVGSDSALADEGGDAATAVDAPAGGTWPPYVESSFWNTAIPAAAAPRPNSSALLARITTNSVPGVLTADVTQNSYPLYVVSSSTPAAAIRLTGNFSYFRNFDTNPDGVRVGAGTAPTITGVPIPIGARSGGGSDSQVLFWDPTTGAEWAFWQFTNNAGTYAATNGYVYDAKLGTGRTALSGRGAGVSKLGGLVTAREVEVTKRVAHAIAFATRLPSPQWVFPATRSDGAGVPGVDIPEGARLQLDPALTEADFTALGLSANAKVIARAMQVYGLILVDGSGRPKAFLESNVTGAWSDVAALELALAPLTRNSAGAPDWTARFRVIDWDRWTGGAMGVLGP